jgi:hypothetical protein
MNKPASSAQEFVDESTMLPIGHIPAIARVSRATPTLVRRSKITLPIGRRNEKKLAAGSRRRPLTRPGKSG